MLFGLPWFAIVALASVIGGLVYAYKEKEMEMEDKRYGKIRELKEMRKLVHNLQKRVGHLEAEAQKPNPASPPDENPLNDIEIEDEDVRKHSGASGSKSKVSS